MQLSLYISVLRPAGSLWAAGRNWLWSIWRCQTRICSEIFSFHKTTVYRIRYTYYIMDHKLCYTCLIGFKKFLTELNDRIQYSGYNIACMYICYNMWLLDYLFRTFGGIIGLILALNRLPYVHNQNIERKTDILSVFLDIQNFKFKIEIIWMQNSHSNSQ